MSALVIAHYDNTPFWMPAGTNKDDLDSLIDLECAIHLKVRLVYGTLDVRTWWLSDSAIRIGVARRSGGEGAEGSSPTLPRCGQLTRCFSAVAELLVLYQVNVKATSQSVNGRQMYC